MKRYTAFAVLSLSAVFVLSLFSISSRAEYQPQGGDIGNAESHNLKTTVCTAVTNAAENCVNIIPGPVWIKGWKLISTAANARAALYDSTTTPTNAATDPVDELSEPTADEPSSHIWPSPIKFENGVTITRDETATTVVIVFH